MLTAIIGGSGLAELEGLIITHREVMRTEYGEPSGPLTFGKMSGRDIVFLNRHGPGHTIPPHRVNYRANVYAMKQAGAGRIIAINAVGGISNELEPVGLVIPDQILDYTYTRKNTFYDSEHGPVKHVDFTYPYKEELRRKIIETAAQNDISLTSYGTYAATQGPRFETAAEIDRMERDGATIVGMTGMPEAILARELDLDYVMIAVVSNAAAGRSGVEISVDEITNKLQLGMDKTRDLLELVIPQF
jgi:5'-deoxy-5'-methylthioadenosine phosphorylase